MVYRYILFILFFYHVLLFISVRDKSYLWFAISVLLYAHFEYFRTPEFGAQLKDVFFWMKFISIPGSGVTMINLFMVSFFIFTSEFLKLKEII